MKRVGIVTCKKRKNKVDDDILLKEALEKEKIIVDILVWDDNAVTWTDYDLLIIRSIWDYHLKLKKFIEWLEFLKQNNIKTINKCDEIINNFNKDLQYYYLFKSGYLLNKRFVYYQKKFKMFYLSVINECQSFGEDSLVLKPIVGASSYNVFKYNKNGVKEKNALSLKRVAKKIYRQMKKNNVRGIVIEPFTKEIQKGEYSVILINKEIEYCIKRYPSRFQERKKTTYVKKIPKQLVECINSLSNIDFPLYSRIDFVLGKNKPIIMEFELTDPDLYIRNLNISLQKNVLNKFASIIVKELGK